MNTIRYALLVAGLCVVCHFVHHTAFAQQSREPKVIYHFPNEQDTLQLYHSFSVVELEQLMALDTALVMVDLRQPTDYATGHIPGSINMPAEKIDRQFRKFRAMQEAQRNVVLISEDGKLARDFVARLCKKNIDRVWYLQGGIQAWTTLGRTVQKGSTEHSTQDN